MRICSEARYPYARTRTLKPLWEGITGSCGWPGQIVGIQQVYNPRCSKSKAKAGERRVFGDLDDTRSWKSSGRFRCRSGDGARGCAVCSSAGADRSRRSAALARFAGRERAPCGPRAGQARLQRPRQAASAQAESSAYTESVLYGFSGFCAQPGCANGTYPEAGLIEDASGSLYGTTSAGGSSIFGAQFSS